MKCLFLLFTLLAPLFGWSQPELSQVRQEIDFSLLADNGTLRAIIIGVGAFQSSDIPPLPNAAAEANRFADSLQRSSVVAANQVKLLTDQEATLGQIAATLDWLRPPCCLIREHRW